MTMLIKKGSSILASVNNPTFIPRIGELIGFKVSLNQTESRRVIDVQYVFDGSTIVICIMV